MTDKLRILPDDAKEFISRFNRERMERTLASPTRQIFFKSGLTSLELINLTDAELLAHKFSQENIDRINAVIPKIIDGWEESLQSR